MLHALRSITWQFIFVWRRDFAVFVRTWFVSVLPPLLEPFFFYLAFGLGLGGMMSTLNYAGITMSYQQYLAPAIIAMAVMNYSFYECSYASFVRMEFQKTFEAANNCPEQ